MSKLIICRGVPASGKTTWAIEWLNEDPANRARVNRDEIRNTNFGSYWGVDEHHVSKIQDGAVHALMNLGRDIVVDNTNLKARNVKELMMIAAQHEYEVEFKDFVVSQIEANWRDGLRNRNVGEAVIKSFFDRYIKDGLTLPPVPTLEGREAKFKPYVGNPNLPEAILVDIDGTLAHMTGRSPYDATRYHEDTVDEHVRELVNLYSGVQYEVIVFSARDDDHETETRAWLEKHRIEFNALHMRPTGDKRNDAIVKDEMFETHIVPNYNVRLVLDDRDRVVNMWRAKGIKCLQVANGDF